MFSTAQRFVESETPISFANAHLLDELGDVAFFKAANRDKLPTTWVCSPNAPGEKIRLHLFVSVMDVMNIDSIGEKFDVKLRLYIIWKADLGALGFPEIAEKALQSGNFYNLSRTEIDNFSNLHPIPVPIIFNKIHEEETEPADIRCYGGTANGTALMWNKAFSITCRERFELQSFPFDMQDLSLEFRLNDPRCWDLYDLTIVSVQFHKQALVQTEWKAFGPLVKRDSPSHKVSKVFLKYRRLSWFYVQNIVAAMLFISSLALISFVMEVTDLGSRVSTCLTVVLTVVAFKFIVTSSLPKVPYNTCIDYYINAASGVLILITYLTVVPSLARGSDNGIFLNKALGILSVVLVLGTFFGWMVYSLRVSNNWRLTTEVHIKETKNWYNFRFSTPDFLDPGYSSSVSPLSVDSVWRASP